MNKKVLFLFLLLVTSYLATAEFGLDRSPRIFNYNNLLPINSLLTAHANLYYHNDSNPLSIAIPNPNVYYNITDLTEYNAENILTDDDSIMTIQYDGQYYVQVAVSFGGGANNEYEVALAKNGLEVMQGCEFHRKLGTGGDQGSASLTCNLDLINGDQLRLLVEDETNPTSPMLAKTIQFHAHRIGGFTNSSDLSGAYLRTDGSNNMTGKLNVLNNVKVTKNLTVTDRIGVGTPTPVSIMELYSSVPILTFTSTNAFSGATINVKGLNQDTDQLFKVQDEGNNKVTILRNGNIGKGTVTPTFDLEIVDSLPAVLIDASGGTTGSGNLWMDADRSSNGAIAGLISIYNNGATPIVQALGYRGTTDVKGYWVFTTSNAERMRIDEDGKVGVGTTSPEQKLHVGAGYILLDNGYYFSGKRQDAINVGILGINTLDETRISNSANGKRLIFTDINNNLMGSFTDLGTTGRLNVTGDIIVGKGIPPAPLYINKTTAGISARFEGNITADDYLTFTKAYKDKSGGTKKALDYILNGSEYYNADGSVKHSAFYGVTKVKEPKIVGYNNLTGNSYELFNETSNTTYTVTETYQEPIIVYEDRDGVSLIDEVSVLRQAVYELKVETQVLKAELCLAKPNTYSFC